MLEQLRTFICKNDDQIGSATLSVQVCGFFILQNQLWTVSLDCRKFIELLDWQRCRCNVQKHRQESSGLTDCWTCTIATFLACKFDYMFEHVWTFRTVCKWLDIETFWCIVRNTSKYFSCWCFGNVWGKKQYYSWTSRSYIVLRDVCLHQEDNPVPTGLL